MNHAISLTDEERVLAQRIADNAVLPKFLRGRARVLLCLDSAGDGLCLADIARECLIDKSTVSLIKAQLLREGAGRVLQVRRQAAACETPRPMLVLPDTERAFVREAALNPASSPYVRRRAQILLSLSDPDIFPLYAVIAHMHGVEPSTVDRVKKKYLRDGLEAALIDRNTSRWAGKRPVHTDRKRRAREPAPPKHPVKHLHLVLCDENLARAQLAADDENCPSHIRKYARILLGLDRQETKQRPSVIADTLGVSYAVLYRVKKRFLAEGADAVLSYEPIKYRRREKSKRKPRLISLSEEDRALAQGVADDETCPPRIRRYARILLSLDQDDGIGVDEIARQNKISSGTVYKIRRRYFREGIGALLVAGENAPKAKKRPFFTMPEDDCLLARKTADNEAAPDYIRRYACILLSLNSPEENNNLADVARQNSVSYQTLHRVKSKYLDDGLEAVLSYKPLKQPVSKQPVKRVEKSCFIPLSEDERAFARRIAEDIAQPDRVRRWAQAILSLSFADTDLRNVAAQFGLSRTMVYYIKARVAQLGLEATLQKSVQVSPREKPAKTRRRRLPLVSLTKEERTAVRRVSEDMAQPAHIRKRAQILLFLDNADPSLRAADIAEQLHVTYTTVFNVNRQFAEEGLERVLRAVPRGRPASKKCLP